jgi:hypothetical protein
VPQGLVPYTIDPTTGELATEYCPASAREYFRPGRGPTEPCAQHFAPPEIMDPWPESGAPDARSEVERAKRGIGAVLRKIFRF